MRPAPDGTPVPRSWQALGSILPRSIREGVFEPAYLDLWRSLARDNELAASRRLAAWLTLSGYLVAAVWYSVPRYVTEIPGTRRARWARRLGLAITFVALLLLVLPRLMRYGY